MLQRNKLVLWRDLDGEAVLLNPLVGCSYNLNRVGTLIWKMLDGKHSTSDIATRISELYEVESDQALRDLENILDDMAKNDLLDKPTSAQTVA